MRSINGSEERKGTREYIKTDLGDTEINREGQGEKTTSGRATGDWGPGIQKTRMLRGTAAWTPS